MGPFRAEGAFWVILGDRLSIEFRLDPCVYVHVNWIILPCLAKHSVIYTDWASDCLSVSFGSSVGCQWMVTNVQYRNAATELIGMDINNKIVACLHGDRATWQCLCYRTSNGRTCHSGKIHVSISQSIIALWTTTLPPQARSYYPTILVFI